MRIWLPSELSTQRIDSKSLDQLSLSSPFFIGRETELENLSEIILDRQTSLLSIVGLGGIGKSRLALELAKSIKDFFPDGIYFIPLASIDDPNLILHQIADEIQLAPHAYYDLERHLRSYLSSKKILIILDNFEQLISNFDPSQNNLSRSIISKLLIDAKELKLVVTSRESLGIQKEFVYELVGLPFPKSNTELYIERYPSIKLFLSEAKRLKSNFELSFDDKALVADICRFVEGLPLGLKLAASWVKALSLKEISEEISLNSNFEAVSSSDIPERQRSMSVVFDQSWKYLSEEEKYVLLSLSVFKGGVVKDVLLEFAQTSLACISRLVDKSLVQVSIKESNEATRYDLHELFKQYIREKLDASPELKSTLVVKHCKIFLNLLAQKTPILLLGDQTKVFKVIDPEIENIRQAWAWAEKHQFLEEMNEALLVLAYYYDSRGLIIEGKDLFENTIQLLMENGLSQVKQSPQEEQRLNLLTNLLVRQGLFYSRLSKYNKAKYCLQQSLAIFHNFNSSEEDHAFSLNFLGHVENFLGKYQSARNNCESALRIREKNNDLIGVADTLINIGFGAFLQGDLIEAKSISEKIVQTSMKKEYKRGLAIGLGSLGFVGLHLGDFNSAKNDLERGMRLCKDLGLNWFEPWFRTLYSQVMFSMGHLKLSLSECYQAQEAIKIIGDHFRLIYVKNSIAKILMYNCDLDEAYKHAYDAFDMAKEIQHPFGEIYSGDLIAKLAFLKGNLDEADLYNNDVLKSIELYGQKNVISSVLRTKAQIKLHHQESEEAKKLLKKSINSALEIGEMPEALTSMMVLSKLLFDENLFQKSMNLLEIINGFNSAPYWVKQEAQSLLEDIRQTKGGNSTKVQFNKPITELIHDIMN